MKKIFIFIAAITLLICCKRNESEVVPPLQNDTIVNKDTTTIPKDTIPNDTISKDTIPNDTTSQIDTTYTAQHLQSAIDRALPMTGLVLWPYNAKERDSEFRKSIALEFAYCLPCRVVTGKTNGSVQYDWSSFDELLDDIASRDHQAVIRFRYEYPSGTEVDGKKGTTAVPQYIKDLPDYKETYNSNAGGDGPTYYADWSNTELQWFTKQFYTDFCARYANDPRLAFLEVGFGHWSEYHIYGTTLKLGQNFPSKQYQKEFFQHLSQVANGLPWLVSIDAGDDTYSPLPNDNSFNALHFGLFDDSFMHKEHEIGSGDGWNEQMWNMSGKDRWKHSPCGGEVSYYTESDQHNFLSPQGIYGVTWEQAATKYHITFMNSNDATDGSYGTAKRFIEASKVTGYRFEITELKSNQTTTILTIKNIGNTPIYRPAFVEINGVRSEFNLMQLQPAQSATLRFNTSGELQVRIVSDFTLIDIPFEANL